MYHQEARILSSFIILATMQERRGEGNAVTGAAGISTAATEGAVAMSGNKWIHQPWSNSASGLWKLYPPPGPLYSLPWVIQL